jgi:hypothetical protein
VGTWTKEQHAKYKATMARKRRELKAGTKHEVKHGSSLHVKRAAPRIPSAKEELYSITRILHRFARLTNPGKAFVCSKIIDQIQ